jgi:hypothetical protein
VWDTIAEQGFHLVYVMGVRRRSAVGRQMARSDTPLMKDLDQALPDWKVEDVPGSPLLEIAPTGDNNSRNSLCGDGVWVTSCAW